MDKFIVLIVVVLAFPVVLAETVPITLDVVEPECAIAISLTTDKQEINEGEQISYINNLSEKRRNYVIEYWAEWENGNVAKSPRNTTNTNAKKFTPKKVKGTQTLILRNKLISVDCIDTTSDDNTSFASVIVHGAVAETNVEPIVEVDSETIPERQEMKQQSEERDEPETREIEGKVVFQSSGLTSRKMMVWIIVAVVGVLGALLVWRR